MTNRNGFNRVEIDQVKNAPLTPEDLRNMKGEPVWIVWPDGRIASQWWIVGSSDWHMMEFDDDGQRDYGTTWIAYRRKLDHFREVTKKDGCDWCQSLNKPFGEFGLGDMLAIGHVEYTFIGDGRMYQQKVRFCPLCGKNLEEQE